MPPKTSAPQSKTQIPEFKSTKGRHVKTNPFINDFSYSMDKEVSAAASKAKKAGKFMSRAERLAANAKTKNKGKAA